MTCDGRDATPVPATGTVEGVVAPSMIKTASASRTGAPTMKVPLSQDFLYGEKQSAAGSAAVQGRVVPTNRQSPTHETLSSADAKMGYQVVTPSAAYEPLTQDFLYGDRTTQQGWRAGTKLQDIQSVIVPPLSESAEAVATGAANRKSSPQPLTQDFLYGDRTTQTGWKAGTKLQDIQSVNRPGPAVVTSERYLNEGFTVKPAAN
jgi:hypothetical protein